MKYSRWKINNVTKVGTWPKSTQKIAGINNGLYRITEIESVRKHFCHFIKRKHRFSLPMLLKNKSDILLN